MSKKIIVADASPLIALAKLDHLPLLQRVFSALHVPEIVYTEVINDLSREDSKALKTFLDANGTPHPNITNEFTQVISLTLDAGETQALALAQALNCGVLMDERRGRKVAQRHNIPAVGILGVLIQSKQQNLIKEVAPLLLKLQDENYRLSDALIRTVLERVNELPDDS